MPKNLTFKKLVYCINLMYLCFRNKQTEIMKTYITIHEPMEVMDTENRVPNVILSEVIETTEKEHEEIRHQYESRQGKYGMNNPSLDKCWWVE